QAHSNTILKILEKRFVLTDLTKSLVVDNAKYFDSNYFNNMINKMGIKLKYISPHHPSSNACERANRTIRTLISMSIDEDHQNQWVDKLPAVELAMRTAINSTTGFSPAELYLGRTISLPVDNIMNNLRELDTKKVEGDRKRYHKDQADSQKNNFVLAAERIANMQKKNSDYYNEKRRDLKFEIGDKVLLKDFPYATKDKNRQVKMMPKFCDEIFTIGKIFSPLTYELIGENGKIRGWHHIFNLKKYNTCNPDPVLPIANTYDPDKVEILHKEIDIDLNLCNFSTM